MSPMAERRTIRIRSGSRIALPIRRQGRGTRATVAPARPMASQTGGQVQGVGRPGQQHPERAPVVIGGPVVHENPEGHEDPGHEQQIAQASGPRQALIPATALGRCAPWSGPARPAGPGTAGRRPGRTGTGVRGRCCAGAQTSDRRPRAAAARSRESSRRWNLPPNRTRAAPATSQGRSARHAGAGRWNFDWSPPGPPSQSAPGSDAPRQSGCSGCPGSAPPPTKAGEGRRPAPEPAPPRHRSARAGYERRSEPPTGPGRPQSSARRSARRTKPASPAGGRPAGHNPERPTTARPQAGRRRRTARQTNSPMTPTPENRPKARGCR